MGQKKHSVPFLRSDSEVNAALRDLFKEELQEANEKGFACAIIGLVKDGLLTVEIGADRMHITVDEMKHLLAQN